MWFWIEKFEGILPAPRVPRKVLQLLLFISGVFIQSPVSGVTV